MPARPMRLAFAGFFALVVAALPTAATACTSDRMATDARGQILRVVAGSDKIVGFKTAEAKEEVATLSLLQPYFVICSEGDMYRITDLPASTVADAETGNTFFVRKDRVIVWPTAEALAFDALIFDPDRPEIVAWENEKTLKAFMRTGDARRFPPAFEEDVASTVKRPRTVRTLPVVSSTVRRFRERRDKRVFRVLLPVAIPPKLKPQRDDRRRQIEKILAPTQFVVVFDATEGMGPVAKDMAREFVTAFESLPKDIYDNSRMGFVFFRDAGDAEKIAVSKMMPMKMASNLLLKVAALMKGGGDAADPVLDAVYVAARHFDWGKSNARRIIIVVQKDEAKPETTGRIHPGVPAGIGAAAIANELRENGITAITVQASAATGPNLRAVLETVAESTGGAFIAHGGGENVAQALARLMKGRVVAETTAAKAIVTVIFDFKDFPAIPLKVRDGARLERLRRVATRFNIEHGKWGVLVREAFVIENPDLIDPRVLIPKSTLIYLADLLSVLGTMGVNASAFDDLASVAGGGTDRRHTISTIYQRRLGVRLQSKLLAFNRKDVAGMTPSERLQLTVRIQRAASRLRNFIAANASEFAARSHVWVPVDVLP